MTPNYVGRGMCPNPGEVLLEYFPHCSQESTLPLANDKPMEVVYGYRTSDSLSLFYMNPINSHFPSQLLLSFVSGER